MGTFFWNTLYIFIQRLLQQTFAVIPANVWFCLKSDTRAWITGLFVEFNIYIYYIYIYIYIYMRYIYIFEKLDG